MQVSLAETIQPLAPDSRLPRYQQLRDRLAALIADGTLRPGEALPSEAAIAADHGLAPGTVRKAIDLLEQAGLVERQQGRGTFVRRADFAHSLFRFFRHTGSDGAILKPEGRLLSRRRQRAGKTEAARLAVAPGTELLHLRRLRLAGGRPLLYERIWLEAARFAPLAELPLAEWDDLLYPLYERACGQLVARARDTLGTARADRETARMLGVEPGEVVIEIARVAFGYDDRPLEYRVSRGPAEAFSYSVEIR